MRMRERWLEDAKEQELYALNKKIQSVIIGGAVADAIGVPYEFKKRDTFMATEMVGYGTYNQPIGSWSDDTSLTLCLVENFTEKGNLDSLFKKFLNFAENGYWTPYGCRFDIGISTLNAIENYKNGVSPEFCGGSSEMDNGNGALMRLSPILFVTIFEKDPQTLIEMVRTYSSITHRHPRSIVGCIIYIEFLTRTYLNNDFNESLDISVEFCNNIIKDKDLKDEFQHYKKIFNKEIIKLNREDIRSDGYVVNSLEAALWCYATTNSYAEAVLKAVNLGGDTDTIAFLTGTMAGLKYGVNSIPLGWVSKIARVNEIKDLCSKFSKSCLEEKNEN